MAQGAGRARSCKRARRTLHRGTGGRRQRPGGAKTGGAKHRGQDGAPAAGRQRRPAAGQSAARARGAQARGGKRAAAGKGTARRPAAEPRRPSHRERWQLRRPYPRDAIGDVRLDEPRTTRRRRWHELRPASREATTTTEHATVAAAPTIEEAKRKALEQLRKVVPVVDEADVEFIVLDEATRAASRREARAEPRGGRVIAEASEPRRRAGADHAGAADPLREFSQSTVDRMRHRGVGGRRRAMTWRADISGDDLGLPHRARTARPSTPCSTSPPSSSTATAATGARSSSTPRATASAGRPALQALADRTAQKIARDRRRCSLKPMTRPSARSSHLHLKDAPRRDRVGGPGAVSARWSSAARPGVPERPPAAGRVLFGVKKEEPESIEQRAAPLAAHAAAMRRRGGLAMLTHHRYDRPRHSPCPWRWLWRHAAAGGRTSGSERLRVRRSRSGAVQQEPRGDSKEKMPRSRPIVALKMQGDTSRWTRRRRPCSDKVSRARRGKLRLLRRPWT